MLALDLYCGAGGASLGLKQSGFFVIGIDIKIPSNYLGDEFIQGDIHNLPVDPAKADFIFASPPCQPFSTSSARWRDILPYENLIPLTRKILKNHPWTCIENVAQAPLRQDLILWGQQFGLHPKEGQDGLWRKRVFELSFFAWNPPKPFMDRSGCYASIAGHMGCKSTFKRRKDQGLCGSLSMEEGLAIMGYPKWVKMKRQELVNSVAPAMARYIGIEAICRMQETGYISHKDRYWQKHYRETLRWAESLDEPPFFKPKGKKKK